MKIYEFKNEWCTDDNIGCIIKLFSTLEKAKTEFENAVVDEIQNCWTDAFDKNGTLKEGYIMVRTDTYFCIYQEGFYNNASTEMTVSEKEVY